MADRLAWLRDGLTKALGLDERRQSQENQEFLTDAADMGSARLDGYARAERYYGGDHRVQLTAREREYLQSSGVPFAENYCETIVDALTHRLKLRGFSSDSEGFQAHAKRFMRARFKTHFGRVLDDAVRLGDGFLILEPDATGKARACHNPPDLCKLVYDSGEDLHGVKCWKTRRRSLANPEGKQIVRLNIYWPDSVEKWFQLPDGEGWAPFVESVGGSHTEVWTMDGRPSGEPLGIAMLHFAHKPGKDCYGRSKLQGVIPQQDALNKTLLDFFWVMDAQGWPQQWATGVSNTEYERSPGFVWTTESELAKFGQLEAADPAKLILGIESQVKRMASRAAVPLHLMLAGSQLPSGESLKTSESGLVASAEDLHDPWGEKACDAVRMGARIEKAFSGDFDEDFEDASLEANWVPAGSRSEVDEANVAAIYQSVGVSQDSIISYLGFDPEEERAKRKQDPDMAAAELLSKARAMQAPTRSEELGGGEQPAQKPENRRV